MVSNFVLSLIRTYIPIAVGVALTWLATRLDFVLDEQSSAGVVTLAVAAVSGLYYLVARWLEGLFPWVSVFLGTSPSTSTPQYHQLPKE